MIKLKEILKELYMYVPGSIKTTHKMSVPSIGYSSRVKKFIEDDIKTMGKIFNKAIPTIYQDNDGWC